MEQPRVFGVALQQLRMRAHQRLAVIQENHLIRLREQVQPVRDQQHDAVPAQLLQMGEYLRLGLLIQGGEGIVQDHHRLFVAQRARQRQALRLTAR